MNTEDIHIRKKAMYNYAIYNNEGTEQFMVRKASNFGYPLGNGEIATSKGINQLEYFSNKGMGKIPKMGKQIINVAGGLLSSLDDFQNFTELIGMMSNGVPANPRGIEGIAGAFVSTPVGFAIAVYEATIVADALANIEQMQREVNEMMEVNFYNAKNKGISEARGYLNTNWAEDKNNTERNRPPKLDSVEVYLPVLLKLLKGKIRNMKQLENLNKKQLSENYKLSIENQPKPPKFLVIYRNIKPEDEKELDLKGYNVFIDSVFCMDEETKSNSFLPTF